MRNEITKEQTLMQTMQARYGGQFQKRYSSLSPQVMETVIRGALMMLTDEQFKQGMVRLNSSRYCPDIAEFQSWCVAGSWWTVNEAWQRACDWSNDSSIKITTLTKKAWDSVYWLVEQGDMKTALNQFKGLYEDYVAKAQSIGKQQEWYVPPVMIETKSKAVAVETKPKLSDQHQKIMARMNELLKAGLSRKQAFDQAQVDVRGEVKQIWGSVA